MAYFDMLIIGSGPAGEYAASSSLKFSETVHILEKTVIGGDCIFHACIPTKAMVHAAIFYCI
ncbi:MAG: FAD-dependent oxidoreductase [Gammaproteobacteria bacterium]